MTQNLPDGACLILSQASVAGFTPFSTTYSQPDAGAVRREREREGESERARAREREADSDSMLALCVPCADLIYEDNRISYDSCYSKP